MIEHIYWNKPGTQEQIKQSFLAEKTVLAASDTVFGLLAPLTQKSYTLLEEIKKRVGKPFLILISSIDKMYDLVDSSQMLQIEKFAHEIWPGPVTLICQAKKGVPSFLPSDQGTVALRIPKHDGLLDLLKDYDGLFSTSANISGKDIPLTVDDIDKEISEQFDFVVVDDQPKESTVPSTIIDISQGDMKVVRKGQFPIEMLQKYIDR